MACNGPSNAFSGHLIGSVPYRNLIDSLEISTRLVLPSFMPKRFSKGETTRDPRHDKFGKVSFPHVSSAVKGEFLLKEVALLYVCTQPRSISQALSIYVCLVVVDLIGGYLPS